MSDGPNDVDGSRLPADRSHSHTRPEYSQGYTAFLRNANNGYRYTRGTSGSRPYRGEYGGQDHIRRGGRAISDRPSPYDEPTSTTFFRSSLPPPPRRPPGSHVGRMSTFMLQTSNARSKAATMYLTVHNIPPDWGTLEIYTHFRALRNMTRITIDRRNSCQRLAHIQIWPLPEPLSTMDWLSNNMSVMGLQGKKFTVRCSWKICEPELETTLQSKPPSKIILSLEKVEFGIKMEGQYTQLFAGSVLEHQGHSRLCINVQQEERASLDIVFPMQFLSVGEYIEARPELWRLRIHISRLKQVYIVSDSDGGCSLVISVSHPPYVYRQVDDPLTTHEIGEDVWYENSTWLRQTNIGGQQPSRPIQLKPAHDCRIDVGRWLTYRILLNRNIDQSRDFSTMAGALTDYNVKLIKCTNEQFKFEYRSVEDLWNWWRPYHTSNTLHALMTEAVELSPPVQYQLEVCLSTGVLSEADMTDDFLKRLSKHSRAVSLLERAADAGHRLHDPSSVFTLDATRNSNKISKHTIKIKSAVITPTTIYFATPVRETSNRVVRKHSQFQDRFLRVKFTDERYKGRLWTNGDSSMDRVLERIEHAMTHGIQIGDRHYEFLAFGNSQLREHGAYFFCPDMTLSVADIWREMGDFSNIKVVAKYASRMGQCFSTTRSIGQRVSIEPIADVEGGVDALGRSFCFTDGVGKISPFLAKFIGMQYSNDVSHPPSVFQFRLAGYKGVLALDPSLRHCTIQLRPSQQKFPAKLYGGLEICRISMFASAYLNQQLILILSDLGVADSVFLTKLETEINFIEEAMKSPNVAHALLQRRVDFNQITLIMAQMVSDGFMHANDPFMITCLHLWRSWYLKTLKERAHLYVDQGAFVLGTTDETGTLKGHFHYSPNRPTTLPEIFIQVPNPEAKGDYQVIKEKCILARNPSLHPGDIRVVQAVDVPALRHLRDCVVLPQNGDRDLASMCSGGDLDGDDYIVIWDPSLIPTDHNQPPMEYFPSDPVKVDGKITTADLITFFVDHVKNDNLPRIATSHRYWADFGPLGVKDDKCLELARLHSQAVDYAKTGVPAVLPRHLIAHRKPHWSEPFNKNQCYRSHHILGQLYDRVAPRSPKGFQVIWNSPFDDRILQACEPSRDLCDAATEIKLAYDNSVRGIMGQFGIESEFEVFTTFVLKHDSTIGEYKFHETIGEITSNLRKEYRELCLEKAGTTVDERDWAKLKPFVVAMYHVTSRQVSQAATVEEEKTFVADQHSPMPMISFPWIFAKELGQIAKQHDASGGYQLDSVKMKDDRGRAKYQKNDVPNEQDSSKPVDVVEVKGKGTYDQGDLLDLLSDSKPVEVVEVKDKGTYEHGDLLDLLSDSNIDGGEGGDGNPRLEEDSDDSLFPEEVPAEMIHSSVPNLLDQAMAFLN